MRQLSLQRFGAEQICLGLWTFFREVLNFQYEGGSNKKGWSLRHGGAIPICLMCLPPPSDISQQPSNVSGGGGERHGRDGGEEQVVM